MCMQSCVTRYIPKYIDIYIYIYTQTKWVLLAKAAKLDLPSFFFLPRIVMRSRDATGQLMSPGHADGLVDGISHWEHVQGCPWAGQICI